MPPNSKPTLIHRKHLDTTYWDTLLRCSPGATIYATSWYLDTLTDGHWYALLWESKQIALPLPYNQKRIYTQVYQPYLCQQLGVFGSHTSLTTSNIIAILSAIPKWIGRVHLHLNEHCYPLIANHIPLTQAPNLILPLTDQYPAIRHRYHQNLHRNLRNSSQAGIAIHTGEHLWPDFLRLWTQHLALRLPVPTHLQQLAARVGQESLSRQAAQVWLACTPDGQAQAGVLWLHSHNQRYINLLNFVSPIGKQCGAMHFLIDSTIQHHVTTGGLIDFEGSSIAGIARFYSSFGAIQSPYAHYTRHLWWAI